MPEHSKSTNKGFLAETAARTLSGAAVSTKELASVKKAMQAFRAKVNQAGISGNIDKSGDMVIMSDPDKPGIGGGMSIRIK